MASRNERVQEALAPSTFPGLASVEVVPWADCRERRETQALAGLTASAGGAAPAAPAALVQHLDDLAQDIVATPGAGGALLAAYAAQARALSMVVEAARRAGSAPLPTAVLRAAQEALAVPTPLPGLAII
jgi:hypothetical protein